MYMNLNNSWRDKLSKEIEKDYFRLLMSFVESEYSQNLGQIFPEENQIFAALNECPIEKVKVVILGQDPYPTKGHANGLCFSTQESVRPLPKSLNNIFKELLNDLDKEPAEHGDLSKWSEQGVLLLNTVLTVKEGEANSHAGKGWEIFTDEVINVLNESSKNIVYILWGAKAQKKAKQVDEENNCVIKSPHPSPLSSYRGFFGSKPFSKTNDYLKKHGLGKIEW